MSSGRNEREAVAETLEDMAARERRDSRARHLRWLAVCIRRESVVAMEQGRQEIARELGGIVAPGRGDIPL